MPSDVDIIDDTLIEKFPLELHGCLRELYNMKNEIAGAYLGSIQIKNLNYSCVKHKIDKNNVDRFTITIPYANDILQWTVLFNVNNLHIAPDFQFDDDTFLGDPDLEIVKKYIPSWIDWDLNNTKSLNTIITELYYYYKQHQINLLKNDIESRAYFEYSCLVGETDIKSQDVDVLVRGGIVTFLIHLDIEFPELPVYNNASKDPRNDAAFLYVKFNKPNTVDSKLYLSARIEQILGDPTNLRIPSFTNSNCLMDYVPLIKKWLIEKIDTVTNNYNKCQEYISTLLIFYKSNIIEYDAIHFSKAVLLFETNGFFWLLTIILGKNFPNDKPRYNYTSVNYLVYDSTYSETLSDYPYSPRWKPSIMIDRAIKKILTNIETFKTNALTKSTT